MTSIDPSADFADERQLQTTPENSRAWWFLGSLVVLRNPEGAPRVPAVIEMTFPPGGVAPLHVHARLNDDFYLLEGEMAVRSGERTLVARPGNYVSLPHGVAYTTRVTSDGPTKVLLVHNADNFLSLIERSAPIAEELRLPEEGEGTLDMDLLMKLSVELETPIIGPPMDEDEARAIVRQNPAVS